MNSEVERLTGWQQLVLIVLRLALGWHLFYQGFGKLMESKWSSYGYLKAGWGPFPWLADQPLLLQLADLTTIAGLMLFGLLIMVGLFTRTACILGALQLFAIYIAVPPFDWTGFIISTDRGSELYVNQTLIEVLALIVVASFDTGRIIGLDILFRHYRRK